MREAIEALVNRLIIESKVGVNHGKNKALVEISTELRSILSAHEEPTRKPFPHIIDKWIIARWIEGNGGWRLFRWSDSYSIHGLGGAWWDIYGGCYGDMHLGEWCEVPESFESAHPPFLSSPKPPETQIGSDAEIINEASRDPSALINPETQTDEELREKIAGEIVNSAFHCSWPPTDMDEEEGEGIREGARRILALVQGRNMP